MPEEVAISVVGLTKRFGSQTIWEDVTFDVPKGKITVILGPSGRGKSVARPHNTLMPKAVSFPQPKASRLEPRRLGKRSWGPKKLPPLFVSASDFASS